MPSHTPPMKGMREISWNQPEWPRSWQRLVPAASVGQIMNSTIAMVIMGNVSPITSRAKASG